MAQKSSPMALGLGLLRRDEIKGAKGAKVDLAALADKEVRQSGKADKEVHLALFLTHINPP